MNAHTLPRADGLYGPLLPDDVRANAQRTRSFADLIADLGAEHDAHVARLNAHIDAVDAFGARIDAVVEAR